MQCTNFLGRYSEQLKWSNYLREAWSLAGDGANGATAANPRSSRRRTLRCCRDRADATEQTIRIGPTWVVSRVRLSPWRDSSIALRLDLTINDRDSTIGCDRGCR